LKLTRKEVLYYAKLARIHLDEDEIEPISQYVSDILSTCAVLSTADTTGVPPTILTVTHCNVIKDDVAKPSLEREQALANAPCSEDGFFKIRPVLDQ
jgi:aspartyl-tRNA(Asn)/glutamyl-tRNA(Gln) amidotransferase subunit C